MATEKVTLRVGSPFMESAEDPNVLFVGRVPPKWIELPADLGPKLAGRQVPVEGVFPSFCVSCSRATPEGPHAKGGAVLYALAGLEYPAGSGKYLSVMECPIHGFLWVSIPVRALKRG